MININILFPSEKARIKKVIDLRIKNEYGQKVTKYKFNYVGSDMVYIYSYLENGMLLYITANISSMYVKDIYDSITICDNMSL